MRTGRGLIAAATCWGVVACAVPKIITHEQPRPFTDLGDGTVRDARTGHRWARDANVANVDGRWSGLTWNEAERFVADMNAGRRPNMGCTSWRVPSEAEMRELLLAFRKTESREMSGGAFVDFLLPGSTEPFLRFEETGYWTSTEGRVIREPDDPDPPADLEIAYAVSTYGVPVPLPKTATKRLWPVCVRRVGGPEAKGLPGAL